MLCRPLTAGRAETKGKGFSFAATSLVGGNVSRAGARYQMASNNSFGRRWATLLDASPVGRRTTQPGQRLVRRFEGRRYRRAAMVVQYTLRVVGGKDVSGDHDGDLAMDRLCPVRSKARSFLPMSVPEQPQKELSHLLLLIEAVQCLVQDHFSSPGLLFLNTS